MLRVACESAVSRQDEISLSFEGRAQGLGVTDRVFQRSEAAAVGIVRDAANKSDLHMFFEVGGGGRSDFTDGEISGLRSRAWYDRGDRKQQTAGTGHVNRS